MPSDILSTADEILQAMIECAEQTALINDPLPRTGHQHQILLHGIDYVRNRGREASAVYRKNHPDRIRIRSRNRRKRLAGNSAKFTKAEWQHALDYFDHRCAVCGRQADFWVIIAQDHWMPVSFGGKTAATNIVPLCHTRITIEGDVMGCNNAKTAKHPERWLIEQFGVKKGKEILERINRYFESLGVQDWWKSDAWR